ncbi:MAG: ferredoxin family protein [Verrucomicrobiaceae bacterium]|nr:ferredoxin family protein [Verrucomicrobiaceae bacterium]
MTENNRYPLRVILYEGKGTGSLEPGARAMLLSMLLDSGYATTVAGDGALIRDDDFDRLLVIGMFDKGAAPNLADADGKIEILTRDITNLNESEILDAVERARDGMPMNQPGSWKPWFPVIDYDRCTNCMQCLSFCLFDVYGVDNEDKIQVQNNDNCKTNCPACSRVCPEVAIMFPKYGSGPINGEPVNDSDLSREKMKVDISALLGGDIYSSLRNRSEGAKSRFSKERDSDKALGERKKCLTKLAAQGDIPPEVLASLPSPEEIAIKAEAATKKAKDVLEKLRHSD